MSSARRSPASRLAVGLALALLVTACTPPRSRNAGFNGYATDIVLGSQTRPTNPPLPPVVTTSSDPFFPSFLLPPPPDPVFAGPGATTTTQKPIVLRCPEAPVDVIPPAAAPVIDKAPAVGVYPYKQTGTWARPDGQKVELPPEMERTIQNLRTEATGDIRYDVVTTQLGETTTMSYAIVKRGSAESDGIYMEQMVRQRADKSVVDQFSPAPPGLKIFAMPASTGLVFRSTATDGPRATSMVLKGAVRAPERIDACGELVEGWSTDATVHVLKSGIEGGKTTKFVSTYVVVPQLGGLIVAEKQSVVLTDSKDVFLQDVPPAAATPPTTQPAAAAPATTPSTIGVKDIPRSPDETTQTVSTNIERLKPIRAPGAPRK